MQDTLTHAHKDTQIHAYTASDVSHGRVVEKEKSSYTLGSKEKKEAYEKSVYFCSILRSYLSEYAAWCNLQALVVSHLDNCNVAASIYSKTSANGPRLDFNQFQNSSCQSAFHYIPLAPSRYLHTFASHFC